MCVIPSVVFFGSKRSRQILDPTKRHVSEEHFSQEAALNWQDNRMNYRHTWVTNRCFVSSPWGIGEYCHAVYFRQKQVHPSQESGCSIEFFLIRVGAGDPAVPSGCLWPTLQIYKGIQKKWSGPLFRLTKKTSGIVENVRLSIRRVAVRITEHNAQHNEDPQRRHLLLFILQKKQNKTKKNSKGNASRRHFVLINPLLTYSQINQPYIRHRLSVGWDAH